MQQYLPKSSYFSNAPNHFHDQCTHIGLFNTHKLQIKNGAPFTHDKFIAPVAIAKMLVVNYLVAKMSTISHVI